LKAPFREAIEDGRLRAVADAWWQCRGDDVVSYWLHMPRVALKPRLPAVLPCRYSPVEASFHVETLTDDLRGLTRLPINGKLIDSLLPSDMLPEARARLLSVIEGPALEIIKVSDSAKPERGAVEERLLMPLRSGGRGTPDPILAVCTHLDRRAAGWVPITQEELSVNRVPLFKLELMKGSA
jgi:hypothetical protein